MKLVILEQVDSIREKNVFWIQKIAGHNRYLLSEIEEGYSFINNNIEYNWKDKQKKKTTENM